MAKKYNPITALAVATEQQSAPATPPTPSPAPHTEHAEPAPSLAHRKPVRKGATSTRPTFHFNPTTRAALNNLQAYLRTEHDEAPSDSLVVSACVMLAQPNQVFVDKLRELMQMDKRRNRGTSELHTS